MVTSKIKPKAASTPKAALKPAPKTAPTSGAHLQSEELMAVQGRAVNPFAAAMPFNSNKGREYGHANTLTPPVGTSEEPTSAALMASTDSEKNSSDKTGGTAVFGVNATIAPMEAPDRTMRLWLADLGANTRFCVRDWAGASCRSPWLRKIARAGPWSGLSWRRIHQSGQPFQRMRSTARTRRRVPRDAGLSAS